MSIAGRGRAMGGPAGVRNSRAGPEARALFIQFGYACHAAHALQLTAAVRRDSARVIAAVFQTP
jgi:hypothetical protein